MALLAALCGLAGPPAAWALDAPQAEELEPVDLAAITAPVLERALSFLAASQQPDGGWVGYQKSDPAITALVAKCFIQSPRYGPRHPIAQRALELVLSYTQPDGGIYVEGQGLRNYQTSVCLMALAATKDAQYRRQIRAAQEFLTGLQWDEGEGYERDSPWYGGTGYGRQKRPDLSNTQMMLEALAQSGLPPEHPSYGKAVTFISRCQMLSLSNDQPLAAGSTDGGFVYTPVNGGESKAGTVTVEGRPRLRTYGSMTYAGFKSLLHARVDRDDIRVQRAVDWIRRYYTMDSNPNMPGAQSQQGLYYYYHVFAKALQAWGEDEITDAAGRPHRWREELCLRLERRQRADGSFVNPADRWLEGNAYLVTAYSVLAIQTALGS
jgi:squalene-hopene/tetraprenyl-beta-curcumene cyclase